jgi:hypothetical protein
VDLEKCLNDKPCCWECPCLYECLRSGQESGLNGLVEIMYGCGWDEYEAAVKMLVEERGEE